jgi:hypothetical protein
MLINGTYIENNCKKLLQKNISFELKNKVLKKGKLVLFYQRNFYLVFILETDKKIKDKIEIPIPFGIEFHDEDDLMYFDYRISTLKKHLFDVEPYFTLFNPKLAKSKYFNIILTINGK